MNTCDRIWWPDCSSSILSIAVFSSSFGFVFLSCPLDYLHMHTLWTPTSQQNVMEKFCETWLQGQTKVKGRWQERHVVKIATLRFPPVSHALRLGSRQCLSKYFPSHLQQCYLGCVSKVPISRPHPKESDLVLLGWGTPGISCAQPSLRISLVKVGELTIPFP